MMTSTQDSTFRWRVGLVSRTLHSHCWKPGSIPGQRTGSHKPKLRPGADKKQAKSTAQHQMFTKNDPSFGKN